jgi:hypothetical protein
MTHVQAMSDTHPRHDGDTADLVAAIEALEECATTCTQCADACLSEDMVAELRRCIRLNLDCAALCGATAGILARRTEGDPGVQRAALDACIAACEACAAECERHGDMHEHCKVCAEACRRCAEACRAVMSAVAA